MPKCIIKNIEKLKRVLNVKSKISSFSRIQSPSKQNDPLVLHTYKLYSQNKQQNHHVGGDMMPKKAVPMHYSLEKNKFINVKWVGFLYVCNVLIYLSTLDSYLQSTAGYFLVLITCFFTLHFLFCFYVLISAAAILPKN